MISLQTVSEFLENCKNCSHGSESGRCTFRSPPPTAGDMLGAWCGNAQDRPASRNYAARVAHTLLSRDHALSPESSWAETWKGLGKPCPEFRKI